MIMRLIDADELIKCIPSEEYNSRFAVMNAPTVEPQKWIPVSERLPSDHERYLLTEEVHYTTGRIIRRVLMAFYDDENDEWYEEMGEDVEVVSYPLAWQPPPKPYKE